MSGIQAQLSWVLRVSFEAAVKVGAGISSESLTRERSISKLMWLLGGFSSLHVVGLRTSVPCWLSVRNHPQFFDTWRFYGGENNEFSFSHVF